MNFTAARAFFTYRTLRAIWNERPTAENYHAMRAAYAAWSRAESLRAA